MSPMCRICHFSVLNFMKVMKFRLRRGNQQNSYKTVTKQLFTMHRNCSSVYLLSYVMVNKTIANLGAIFCRFLFEVIKIRREGVKRVVKKERKNMNDQKDCRENINSLGGP